MKTRALIVTLGGAIAVAVAILAAALSMGGGTSQADVQPSDRVDPGKVAKSAALAEAPTIVPSADAPLRADHASLRGATARLAAQIPLPEGGDFNGLHFDNTVAQGGMRDDSLARMLQANAACQWYVALAAGREVETAKGIIPQIVRWSGLRNDGVWDAPTADFAAGGRAAFAQMTATCEATRADQRAYALQHGLAPTS